MPYTAPYVLPAARDHYCVSIMDAQDTEYRIEEYLSACAPYINTPKELMDIFRTLKSIFAITITRQDTDELAMYSISLVGDNYFAHSICVWLEWNYTDQEYALRYEV